MKVKILNCYRKEYENQIVQVHYKYANGIDFITSHGLVFVDNKDFEIIRKGVNK